MESLVIASCVTPTDPVLANAICKGRFAEEHVPPNVRNLISKRSLLVEIVSCKIIEC